MDRLKKESSMRNNKDILKIVTNVEDIPNDTGETTDQTAWTEDNENVPTGRY